MNTSAAKPTAKIDQPTPCIARRATVLISDEAGIDGQLWTLETQFGTVELTFQRDLDVPRGFRFSPTGA